MIRSILQLFVGTSLAQAVTLVSTVWMARVYYGPDAFGQFGVYWAWVMILSTLGTYRFESLIMLPDTHEKAFTLALLATRQLAISCFLACIIVCLYGLFFGFSWGLMMIPFGAMFFGLSTIIIVFLSRLGQFADVSQSRIIVSVFAAISQWILVRWLPVTGLIVGNIVGLALGVQFLRKRIIGFSPPTQADHDAIRSEYNTMRRTMLRSTSLNVLYQYLHPVLIFRLFSEALSGHFFMAQKLLQAPVSLVISSISQVFFREAGATRHVAPERLFGLMLRVSGTVGAILAIPMLIMGIWGQDLLVWLLGEKWIEAGSYLSLLVFSVFAHSLYSPVSSIAEVLNRVKIELAVNVYFLLGMFVSLFSGWWFGNFRLGLTCFVVMTSVGYLSILACFLRLTWLLKIRKTPSL